MKKLLVANRSEIAVRIIRAAKAFGLETVSVYSSSDQNSIPCRLADESIFLGGARAAETYLDQNKLIDAAVQSGADAIHPGYGFLAENADFARLVRESGLTYVGPAPESIELMGDKNRARIHVASNGVPVLPGTEGGLSVQELVQASADIGFPLLVKAVAGGSGRGMRVVRSADELEAKIQEAKREAKAGFSNDEVILEKFLENPRHIEVQVFGDQQGNVVHFGERECSIQRRQQKLIEESPAPCLHPALRERICEAAVLAAKSVNYLGAGTVEFLVAGGEQETDGFYFLEMNTRIQVEHPITEECTGCDLVRLQLSVANGESIPWKQEDIRFSGNAIEFRVYGEDTSDNFRPATGRIRYMSRAGGPGVREDGWVEAGTQLSPYFDSLLCKLIVTGSSREEMLSRARETLRQYVVEGFPTTLGFHRWILGHPDFISGKIDVAWVERNYQGEQVPAGVVGPFQLPATGPDEETEEG